MNLLVASDLYQSHGLGVARLESNRSSGWDIKSASIGFDAIKVQLRIRLAEMIVGPNLGLLKSLLLMRCG